MTSFVQETIHGDAEGADDLLRIQARDDRPAKRIGDRRGELIHTAALSSGKSVASARRGEDVIAHVADHGMDRARAAVLAPQPHREG